MEATPSGSRERTVRARIGWVSLMLAGAMLVSTALPFAAYLIEGEVTAERYGDNGDVITIGLLVLLGAVARSPWLASRHFTRVAIALQLAACASASAVSLINGWELHRHVVQLSWTSLMLLAFTLITPLPLPRARAFAWVAAATVPLTAVLLTATGVLPFTLLDVVATGLAPLSAAAVAVQGARVLHGARARLDALGQQLELLQQVMDREAAGVLVFDAGDRLLYANQVAHALGTRPFGHENRAQIAARLPAVLGDALRSGRDGVFGVQGDAGVRRYQVATRTLAIQYEPHVVFIVRAIGAEVRQRELNAWRRLLRTLTHELRNTLAPASSMLFTAGHKVAAHGADTEEVARLLETVKERLDKLASFTRSYAALARVPQPRLAEIELRPLLDSVARLHAVGEVTCPDGLTMRADAAQLERVLVNLVRNALEADSAGDDVSLRAERRGGQLLITVADRGHGMTEEVARRASAPFFSTREGGSGLGLALSCEIAEAHGGTLSLVSRARGGVEATLHLPL